MPAKYEQRVTINVPAWIAKEIAAGLRMRAAFHSWAKNLRIAARLQLQADAIDTRIKEGRKAKRKK